MFKNPNNHVLSTDGVNYLEDILKSNFAQQREIVKRKTFYPKSLQVFFKEKFDTVVVKYGGVNLMDYIGENKFHVFIAKVNLYQISLAFWVSMLI